MDGLNQSIPPEREVILSSGKQKSEKGKCSFRAGSMKGGRLVFLSCTLPPFADRGRETRYCEGEKPAPAAELCDRRRGVSPEAPSVGFRERLSDVNAPSTGWYDSQILGGQKKKQPSLIRSDVRR